MKTRVEMLKEMGVSGADAEQYIHDKLTEGVYGAETEKKLLQLLKRNSVYR